ncbi:hypothetical protein [Spiroplasma culicicola]|uniref:C2H2-type domain-containing protein n=1 Tax=Spiroplasma culicicola AES-1 TaxID=1276246 RepID=W6A6Y0_9MOLU|nr:hypothetical protein [Spiroplasma culicicola]AHI52893.1 hypothetical protein SCULI_v1c05520 [Spiroplasma culicicola AES-1]
MSDKKVFEMDENLKLRTDLIYFHQTIRECIHKEIALDSRDEHYKCTNMGCWMQFWFRTEEEYHVFDHRVIKEFDFVKSEKEYKKKIKSLKLKAKKEKEMLEKSKNLY